MWALHVRAESWQALAERVERVIQRHIPRGVPEQAVVEQPDRRDGDDRGVPPWVQRGTSSLEPRTAHAAKLSIHNRARRDHLPSRQWSEEIKLKSVKAQNDWLARRENRWAAPRIHGRKTRQVLTMFAEQRPHLTQRRPEYYAATGQRAALVSPPSPRPASRAACFIHSEIVRPTVRTPLRGTRVCARRVRTCG